MTWDLWLLLAVFVAVLAWCVYADCTDPAPAAPRRSRRRDDAFVYGLLGLIVGAALFGGDDEGDDE